MELASADAPPAGSAVSELVSVEFDGTARAKALENDCEPPRMHVEAHLHGARYVEDRDTAAVRFGSRERPADFTQQWVFSLEVPPDAPWRLVA